MITDMFEKYRQIFPITQDNIYVNHAAVSPLSTSVTSAITDLLQQLSVGKIDLFSLLLEQRAKLKKNLAELIQADPDYIAIIGNTSEGLNWLAGSLKWQEGDRILLVQDEFPANIYPFMNLQRLGVVLDFVPLHDGKIYPADIERLITSRTKLLSISFVEFLTGFRNDLDTIGNICKKHNVVFSVDGIQGIGAFPLDVQKAQIDFICAGGHKWLMSPQGCGFMYIAPALHARLQPVFAGWLSVKNCWDFLNYKLDFLDDAQRYEIGTPNFIGIVGAVSATGILVETNPLRIQTHLLQLGDKLIGALGELGLSYIGSSVPAERSGIYSFKSAEAAGTPDTEGLFKFLTSQQVHLSLRNKAIRFSPHFYNTESEIEQIVNLCQKYIRK
jgi:cysteine desulfurase/selenocysteine lyase